MTFTTHSASETEAVGAKLAEMLETAGRRNAFIALFGDMGVGKTIFSRGFCAHFGIARVKSPTYTVVNEYASGRYPVLHFDLYRLEGPDDVDNIGYYDYLSRDAYILCEWPERLEGDYPDDALLVSIQKTEDAPDERIITIEGNQTPFA